MASLHELYRMTDENLASRRAFIGLTERDIHTLAELRPWAEKVIPGIVTEFYDHQFTFGPTAEYFRRYAAENGRSLDALRQGLEKAQQGYLTAIFAEAAGSGRFGTEYFESRLRVGRVHNVINLPMKWYLGSYMKWFDLFSARLTGDLVRHPWRRHRAERALLAVFNYDSQAVVEAFYYDTFASMGVDLAEIRIDSAMDDLCDHSADLKAGVSQRLEAVAKATSDVLNGTQTVSASTQEAGHGVTEVAAAVTQIAQGAERQVRIIENARVEMTQVSERIQSTAEAAADTAATAARAREVAGAGVRAATEANDAMQIVHDGSERVTHAIEALAAKSDQIGSIVSTIAGIADQTNLLALNAAIEAARAGEQGRGFAVVADEVRSLAERSRQATAEIRSLIENMQGDTQAVVEIVKDTARSTLDGARTVSETQEALRGISSMFADIDDGIQRVAHASEEIVAHADSMKQTIEETASVAEQTSAATEQVSASSEQSAAALQEIAALSQQMAGSAEELAGIFSTGQAELAGAAR